MASSAMQAAAATRVWDGGAAQSLREPDWVLDGQMAEVGEDERCAHGKNDSSGVVEGTVVSLDEERADPEHWPVPQIDGK